MDGKEFHKIMVIVVEGVDKSGKSTLVETIAKSFPGIMIKITDKPKNSDKIERAKIITHYSRIMDLIERNPNVNIILDRFFPSELCYSIKRGYEAKEDKFFDWVQDWFRERDHLFIFCHPGESVIEKRITDVPDDYVTKDENLMILKRYEDFFRNAKLNSLRVNTNVETQKIVEEIKKYLDEHKRYRSNGEQGTLL